jgi:hypothetical protein
VPIPVAHPQLVATAFPISSTTPKRGVKIISLRNVTLVTTAHNLTIIDCERLSLSHVLFLQELMRLLVYRLKPVVIRVQCKRSLDRRKCPSWHNSHQSRPFSLNPSGNTISPSPGLPALATAVNPATLRTAEFRIE